MLFAPGRPKGGFTPYPAMDILSDFSSSEADLGTNVPSYFLMVLLFTIRYLVLQPTRLTSAWSSPLREERSFAQFVASFPSC